MARRFVEILHIFMISLVYESPRLDVFCIYLNSL